MLYLYFILDFNIFQALNKCFFFTMPEDNHKPVLVNKSRKPVKHVGQASINAIVGKFIEGECYGHIRTRNMKLPDYKILYKVLRIDFAANMQQL